MKLQKIISLLVVLSVGYTSCSVLIEKATFVANTEFKNGVTAVVWWSDKPGEETNFIKQFNGNIVVVSLQENKIGNEIITKLNLDRTFTQTVFFGADVREVEYFVSILYDNLVAAIRLIVILSKPASFTELTELMKVAWNNDVADILILNSSDGEVTLTTYFPYSNGKCGDSTPVHLNPNSSTIEELFPKKFLNFHGCDIRASLNQMSPYSRLRFENNTFVSLSGIDGNILHLLIDKLNATLKVISAKDHGGLGTIVNGTPTGSFSDLLYKKSDIISPGLMISIKRYHHAQFSTTYFFTNIIWVGPRRKEASEFLRVLQPLLSPISPAIFSTAIIFIVVIITIRRFGLHRSFSKNSVMLQTFIIFLGNYVKFESKFFLMNFLFILWIWFCMVVRIAYQGDLFHGLQRNIMETRLGKFESAVKLVDGYGGAENIKEMYNGTQHYNNFKVIQLKDMPEVLKAMEKGKNYLIAIDKQVALDAAPNIQIIDDEPVTGGPVSFCMRPGWPAVTDIDDVLLQLIEMGFVDFVSDKHTWEWEKFLRPTERSSKALALKTLIGCFYALAVMYGICTLVFIAEINNNKKKRNEKKTFYKRKYGHITKRLR